jgi:predicted peptidase
MKDFNSISTAIMVSLVVLTASTTRLDAQADTLEEPEYQERRALAQEIRPRLLALADKFEARTYDNEGNDVIPYRLFKPEPYDSGQAYPLVVYLHGGPGSGRDNLRQISGGNVYGARIWALPENQKRHPCFILAPQLMRTAAILRDMPVRGEKISGEDGSIEGTWRLVLEMPSGQRQLDLILKKAEGQFHGSLATSGMSDTVQASYKNGVLKYQSSGRISLSVEARVEGTTFEGTASRVSGKEMGPRVMGLVRDLFEEFSIDRDRVYITGQSMGGGGTWGMLAMYPEVFAAAMPICGMGDVEAAADIVKHGVAIWAFHGDIDQSVPVEASRQMVKALKAAGGQPRYTEYPGVKHDSWVDTYPDPDVRAWLFAQKRSN